MSYAKHREENNLTTTDPGAMGRAQRQIRASVAHRDFLRAVGMHPVTHAAP